MNAHIMKKEKYVMLLAVLAMMLVLPACGNDDEPGWKDRDVEFETQLLNHVYDTSAGDACTVTEAKNKLVFHRKALTADLHLLPGASELGGATFDLTGLKLTLDDESGRYSYVSATTPNPHITDIRLTVDFNEQAMDVYYTIDNRYRVMSTMPQVFFLGNTVKQTYDPKTSSIDNSCIFQFDIDSKSMTATVHISPLTNTKLALMFETIIMRGVPVEATAGGYALKSDRPVVVSVYRRIDSSAGTLTTTDARDSNGHQLYPMSGMKAKLSLVSGVHETTFTMGSVEEKTQPFTVQAKGTFYKEKNIK